MEAAGDAALLGAGAGDVLVAAEAATGAQNARAATQAGMSCNLFFMGGLCFWVEVAKDPRFLLTGGGALFVSGSSELKTGKQSQDCAFSPD